MPLGANVELANSFNDWRIRTNEILDELKTNVLRAGNTATGNVTLSGWITTTGLKAGDGTNAAPSISFANATSAGLNIQAGAIGMIYSGTRIASWAGSGFYIDSGLFNIRNAGATTGVNLHADSDHTLAQRNGASAQTLRIYNTYTDATNYERAQFIWNSSLFTIGTEATGTGTVRDLDISRGGVTKIRLNSTDVRLYDDIQFNTDNAYDIGANGATRPRNVYVAGQVVAGTSVLAGQFGIPSKINITSASDGVLKLGNAADNDFSSLLFGGTSSIFPSLKRSGTELQVRLADDSAYGTLRAGTIAAEGLVSVTGNVSVSGNVTSANLATGTLNVTGTVSGNVTSLGVHTIPIPGTAFSARLTNGANTGTTGLVDSQGRQLVGPVFDGSTVQYVQIGFRLPKSVNAAATMTASFDWTANTSSSGNVAWKIFGTAFADGDGNPAYGTAVLVSDAFTGNNKVHQTSNTASFSLANSPANGEWVEFLIARQVDDAGDTLSANAYLLGVSIHCTLASPNDA